MKKFLFASVFIIVSALCTMAALGAGGKIRFGNLAVVPSFGIEETHDDNIYVTKNDKVSDWITHFRPGLMLDYTIEGRGKFQFGYQGDYAYYSAKKDNEWKSHLLFLDLDYLSPGGLILRIQNHLDNTEYPFFDKEDYREGEQSERWQDDLNSAVGFKFSDRFKLLAYYNYHRQDYKNTSEKRITNSSIYYGSGNPYQDYYYTGTGDFRQDYYYNEAGLGFETKISHKTWAFLRYYTGAQQYFTHRDGVTSSNDASYDWQRVNTGLTWDSGGRYNGEVNIGYQWNDHQNNHDQYGNRYKDQNNWIAATRFTYTPVLGRTFLFTANRELYQLESSYSGYYLKTSFGLGMEQRIKSKFFLRLGYMYSINRFKNEGNLPLSYSSYERRKDTVNNIYTGLRYTIREWLTAAIEYNYGKDHSSDSGSGYQYNRIGISLEFKPADYH